MLYSYVKKIDRVIGFPRASAHCDIPCKIYDPSAAQVAALTVIRMMDLIEDLGNKMPLSLGDQAQLTRLTAQKETHAKKVKDEVCIIWGDYFKKPQFEQVPNIHSLVHTILLQSSKCKQHVNADMALELLVLVNQFAEAFWHTKGVDTIVATCPYPPAQNVVYPVLA